jgi:predicted RNA-binding Zn-ribbon protein involved in translation (DUF1610 family)
MSSPRTQQVRCPHCGQTHAARVHDTIDAVREPELKAELLSTRLFQHACPSCGRGWHGARTLAYHDVSKGLLIWLYPGETTGDVRRRLRAASEGIVEGGGAPSYAMRLVSSPHDLVEKILIAEAGLSDVMVEVLKVFAAGLVPGVGDATLRLSPPGPGLLFGHDLPFALVKPGEQPRRVSVPWSNYELVAERLPGLLVTVEAMRGELATVDREFALAMIKTATPSP